MSLSKKHCLLLVHMIRETNPLLLFESIPFEIWTWKNLFNNVNNVLFLFVVCIHFYNVGFAAQGLLALRRLHWRMLKHRTKGQPPVFSLERSRFSSLF